MQLVKIEQQEKQMEGLTVQLKKQASGMEKLTTDVVYKPKVAKTDESSNRSRQ